MSDDNTLEDQLTDEEKKALAEAELESKREKTKYGALIGADGDE